MSFPPNPYAGGMPGRRTPDRPNTYHEGMPGQRSPWGQSSPRHYSPFPSPRRHNQSMGTPSNQWHHQQQQPPPPHFTPPHTPNSSPIPHHQQQSFLPPNGSNKRRGPDGRGRPSMGGPPHGDKRHGQRSFHKDRRFSGSGQGGGHKRGSDVPIERYFREDMLRNPWAELEKEDGGHVAT